MISRSFMIQIGTKNVCCPEMKIYVYIILTDFCSPDFSKIILACNNEVKLLKHVQLFFQMFFRASLFLSKTCSLL